MSPSGRESVGLAAKPGISAIWLAAPIAAAAAFYVWNFVDLFPLIEYREWIDRAELESGLHFFYHNAIRHTVIGFSRSTSFLAVALFTSACGPAIACHNFMHIALLLAAAALLGLTLLRLSECRRPVLVAGTVAFFLFTVPVLDAVAWQATIHDKLAVLLAALFTWYVARPRLPVLLDQPVLLALTILTVNAKESAWVVLPSLMLLAAALRLAQAPAIARALPAAIGATLARFALPLAYAVMHIGLAMVQLMTIDIAELARVTSGSAGILAAFLAAFALALAAASAWTRLMLLWAAVSFALALAIPLKTSAQSPFYLLVPLYYLSATLFWIASAALDALRARAMRAAMAAALTAALMLHVTGFLNRVPPYREIADLSRNFQTALEAIRQEIARDPPSVLRFDAPADQPQAYKLSLIHI